MPARADFDPVEMVPLLPHLFLVDVAEAGDLRRFRYRLIGTAIVTLLGRDSTGKWADDALHGDNAPGIQGLFSLASETRAPVVVKGHLFFISERSWTFVEGLLLPLSANGADVDMLLVGLQQVPVPSGRASGKADPGAFEVFAEPKMLAYRDPVIEGRRHSDRE